MSVAPFLLPATLGPDYCLLFLLIYACYALYYLLRQVVYLRSALAEVESDIGKDWQVEYANNSVGVAKTTNWDDVMHCIIIPCYKEAPETLEMTLDVLSNHQGSETSYFVILAMEESEGPTARAQAIQQIERQSCWFAGMGFTYHPANVPGESRGKSSNVAYAAKQTETVMVDKLGRDVFNSKLVMLTVIDADAHMQEAYFKQLTYHICTDQDIHRAVFAMPVSYFRNFYKCPVTTRTHDMLYTNLVLHNLSRLNGLRFPSGHYSLSLKMSQNIGCAWDSGPEAIGEDVHTTLRCMYAYGDKLRVVPIYVPVSCTNVHGDNKWQAFQNKYNQVVRHFMGGLDVAYCITNGLARGELSAATRVWLVWKMLEFHVLAPTQFFCAMIGPFYLTTMYPEINYNPLVDVLNVLLCLMIVPAILNAYYFNHFRLVCARMPSVSEKDDNREIRLFPATSEHHWTNFFDWLILPVSGFVLGVVAAVHSQCRQMYTIEFVYNSAEKPMEYQRKVGAEV